MGFAGHLSLPRASFATSAAVAATLEFALPDVPDTLDVLAGDGDAPACGSSDEPHAENRAAQTIRSIAVEIRMVLSSFMQPEDHILTT
ncbi:MAG: hypothetical protein KDI09_14630 [Halioglobus sp.]|nr:hypothetical protein [Halioglobus sp.]